MPNKKVLCKDCKYLYNHTIIECIHPSKYIIQEKIDPISGRQYTIQERNDTTNNPYELNKDLNCIMFTEIKKDYNWYITNFLTDIAYPIIVLSLIGYCMYLIFLK